MSAPRSLGLSAVLLSMLLSVSALAAPVTKQTFDRLWGKYAVDFFEKPKMGCVCFDGPNDFELGSLVRFGDGAACYIPGFDANDQIATQSPCNGMFVPLSK